ncbi:hypothetical protein Tco_0307395 [Tanacetum coccineum]
MDNAIAFPSVPQYKLMDCPVVVDALIEGFRVRRIHVDGGSSSEVMYEHCFRNLSYRTRSRLKESRVLLVGFLGEVSYPLGVIDLEVTIGECGKTQTVIMEFPVVKSLSPYDALLVLLAPVKTRPRRPRKEPMQLDDMEEKQLLDKGRKPPKYGVEKKIVENDNYPEQLVTIGRGIPRAITEHITDTYPHIEPKAQKKRSLALNKRKVVTDEVNELLKAGIVRRVRYPTWVVNLMLIKKVDGSWRMCIDFKDLNKAYPKDLYPFSEIN